MIEDQVILFSTQAEALEYRKQLALNSQDSLMGVTATTPEALLADLWEVWGSCERIITSAQRIVVVNRLLSAQTKWVESLGTAALLADFLRDYAIFINEEFCAAHQQDFTQTDSDIVRFIRLYEEELIRFGLIELAQVAWCLAPSVSIPEVVVRTRRPLSAYQQHFFKSVAGKVQEESQALGMPENLEYLLLKPSGKTASSYLVYKQIVEAGKGASVLVTSPDPLLLFNQLEQPLIEQGLSLAVKGAQAFGSTLFGQAFNAVYALCNSQLLAFQEDVVNAAVVFIESPYAQLDNQAAKQLARTIRADRTLTSEGICNALRTNSKAFEYFEELTQDSEASILFAFFEEILRGISLNQSQRSCEFSILSSAKKLYFEAQDLQVQPGVLYELLNQISVPYSQAAVPISRAAALVGEGDATPDGKPLKQAADGKPLEQAEDGKPLAQAPDSIDTLEPFSTTCPSAQPYVLITTFNQAAQLPSGCCDLAILTSLDSGHYSGSSSTSTLSEFLERYQLPYQDNSLEVIEQAFACIASASRKKVVFEFAEQDLSGNEQFPAFFLESFLNMRKDADKAITEETIGESLFDLTARMRNVSPDKTSNEEVVARGLLTEEQRKHLFRYESDAQGVQHLVVSPSALETYLKCPYLWFVQRKLHLDEEAEAFGPREKGTFAHAVFQAFYQQMAEEGFSRVTQENLNQALALFDSVFDTLVEQQAEAEIGNRLVAVSELEKEELALLKNQLAESIIYQSQMFKGFHVKSHELEISSDEKVVYAGAIIHGRVDRIDVDAQGNFIVVDYKGSTFKHEAGFSEDALEGYQLPNKVQALIYAQVLRRLNANMHPKGAVYLSYQAKKPKGVLKGSISELLGDSAIFSTRSNIVQANFEFFLDLVEQKLKKTVDQMASGEITPNPSTPDACKYCPVLYCEKRIDGSN